MSAKVLRARAMVTYLKLRFQSVKKLVKLVDVVVGTLPEHPHNFTGILVGICDLGAPRAAFFLLTKASLAGASALVLEVVVSTRGRLLSRRSDKLGPPPGPVILNMSA